MSAHRGDTLTIAFWAAGWPLSRTHRPYSRTTGCKIGCTKHWPCFKDDKVAGMEAVVPPDSTLAVGMGTGIGGLVVGTVGTGMKYSTGCTCWFPRTETGHGEPLGQIQTRANNTTETVPVMLLGHVGGRSGYGLRPMGPE